jgi:hypothetical protein
MLFLTNRSGLAVELELGTTVAIGQYETAALVVNADPAEEFTEAVNFSSGHREEVVESKYSTRQTAAPYPLGSKHVRIAQPWDLKRGLEFDVLREPGRTAVQLAARFSAVKLLAPDCKTLSRARDIAIPGVPNPRADSDRMSTLRDSPGCRRIYKSEWTWETRCLRAPL